MQGAVGERVKEDKPQISSQLTGGHTDGLLGPNTGLAAHAVRRRLAGKEARKSQSLLGTRTEKSEK